MLAALTALLMAAAPPAVTGDAAIVVDLDSGKVLFQKNANRVHAIASISKLMAMRVVLQRGLKLEDSTTIERSDYQHTRGGSRSRLIKGRAYKNGDLLHAALMGSDNRAVVALGRTVGYDFSILPKVMTLEAKALGLMHSHFSDPTGISHENISTASEVASLLKVIVETKELAEVTRKAAFTTSALERSGIPLSYRNTNILTHKKTRKILAGKTGFNSAARWCVATAIELPSGRRIGIVVLGAPGRYTRFRDARRLEKWAKTLPWTAPAPQPAKEN
jgi:D-alanyl-D-alanine endopeptidase (penicillin-binding protein 7)